MRASNGGPRGAAPRHATLPPAAHEVAQGSGATFAYRSATCASTASARACDASKSRSSCWVSGGSSSSTGGAVGCGMLGMRLNKARAKAAVGG